MDSDAPLPVFRSFKRRRLARPAPADDPLLQPAQQEAEDASAGASPEPAVVPPSRRRLFRARNMGLDVSVPSTVPALQQPRGPMPEPVQISKPTSLAPIKFAPPTGLVRDDLEKHM
jgi:hypothetical protein